MYSLKFAEVDNRPKGRKKGPPFPSLGGVGLKKLMTKKEETGSQVETENGLLVARSPLSMGATFQSKREGINNLSQANKDHCKGNSPRFKRRRKKSAGGSGGPQAATARWHRSGQVHREILSTRSGRRACLENERKEGKKG